MYKDVIRTKHCVHYFNHSAASVAYWTNILADNSGRSWNTAPCHNGYVTLGMKTLKKKELNNIWRAVNATCQKC